jgi:hypothetical protein
MTFQYRKRSDSAVKEASSVQNTKFFTWIKPGIKIFTPTKPTHVIRVLPATYDGPIRSFGKEVVLHSNVGPDERNVLCLKAMKGEPDPVEELLEDARARGKAQEPWAKSLKAKVRVATWIIDRDDEAAGPQLWPMAQQTDASLNRKCLHEKSGRVVEIEHPDKGHDVELVTTKDNNGYTVYDFEIASRSSYLSEDEDQQEEWLEYITKNAPDKILVFDSYDEIAAMLKGVGGLPAKSADREQFSRSSRRGAPVEEFGSELPSWASDKEPEEKPRSRRAPVEEAPDLRSDVASRSSRRAAPVEEEPEEKPRSRRAAPVEEEPEEKPRSRRAAPVDEEPEEKPRSRRAAPVDEEPEEKPRSRRAEPEELSEPEPSSRPTRREALSKRSRDPEPDRDVEAEEVEDRAPRRRRRA